MLMYDRGLYTYKVKNKDVKTHYSVEYTRNQKVLDMMDTTDFTFDMLDKAEFDYLEDAVSFWNSMYYEESVLYVMLFEEVILDGEIILEQCKDMVVPSVLDKISRQRVKRAEIGMEAYKTENDILRKFIEKHGIDVDKIIHERMNENV